MIIKSILSKLMLSYIIIILITLALVSSYSSHLLEGFFVSAKERELMTKGEVILTIIREYLMGRLDERAASYVLAVADRFLDARIQVIDKEGLVTLSSEKGGGMGRRLIAPEIKEVLNGKSIVKRVSDGNKWRRPTMVVVALPVLVNDSVIGAIVMNSPVVGVVATLTGVRRLIFYAALLSITFASAVGFFFSRSISRPLREMKRVALNMAEGDFKGKVEVTSRDEVGELAKTFNYLTTRLEGTIEALHEEKDRMASMVKSITEGVIWVDRNGTILLSNRPAHYLFKMHDVEGKALREVISSTPLLELFEATIRYGTSFTKTLEIRTNKHILAHVSPVHGRAGNVIGAVGLFNDVSDLHEVERMRREFVANVSHELRTPLTGIRGFVEPLLDGTVEDEETRRKYLEIIRDETIRLNRLVDDLLKYSRLEAGKMELNLIPLDISDVIRNVGFKMQFLADSKGIELKCEMPDQIPLVYGAEDKIEEVLCNLIDNAIRYTPEGGIIVISVEDEGPVLRVSVKDSGPGIDEEDLPHIWERFYKADKSRSRSQGGTGLGLAIVKAIVEAHGGTVSVESKPGEGALFSFTLRKVDISAMAPHHNS